MVYAESLGAVGFVAVGAWALLRTLRQKRDLVAQVEDLQRTAAEEKQRRLASGRDGSEALVSAKREEAALRQSKERFLEVVSHELRTPLASIAAATEILADETDRDDSRIEWIDMTVESTRRLTRTVERIEELVQLESKAAFTGFEIVPLDEVVTNLQSRIVALEGMLNVRCHFTWPSRPIGLEVNGAQLTRMLELLLENALRFSPTDERATLTIEPVLSPDSHDDHVRFSIEDHGPGIPEAQRRAIFESFHQVRENLSDKPLGIGLGLTICTAIAGNLGCRIRVESRKPKGSRFVFELPCRFRSDSDRLEVVNDRTRTWEYDFVACAPTMAPVPAISAAITSA